MNINHTEEQRNDSLTEGNADVEAMSRYIQNRSNQYQSNLNKSKSIPPVDNSNQNSRNESVYQMDIQIDNKRP